VAAMTLTEIFFAGAFLGIVIAGIIGMYREDRGK
jgi:hypothetical protein